MVAPLIRSLSFRCRMRQSHASTRSVRSDVVPRVERREMADAGIGLTEFPAITLTVIVGATVFVLIYISTLFKSSVRSEEVKSKVKEPTKTKEKNEGLHGGAQHNKGTKKKYVGERWGRDTKHTFSHPWLMTSLKGHSGRILDMDISSNGKLLATCAEDRSLHIWATKDFSQKEKKSLRVNVEYDHASKVRWSPDCKAFLILRATENTIEVYKVQRKPEGGVASVEKGFTYPKHHSDEVIGLDIACTGRYVMTCSEKTDLIIWDLKGQQILGKVETLLMSTTCARISPCGRFVAASGFTPDLKVWEVSFGKSGEFKQIARAFELKGHTSGIHDFGFNCDSSRMATVSKDGTWRLYNTKIEFEKGEDPHLLTTGKYEVIPDVPARLAVSPDGSVVAVASGTSLYLYSARTGTCEASIHDIHAAPINCVLFDAAGKYVLTTGDKHVHVIHNVVGQKELLASARSNLRTAGTSAMRERLQAQIATSEAFLQKMGVKGA